MSLPRAGWGILLALAAGLAAGAAWFAWSCTADPATAFLTARSPAHWILYPGPPRAGVRPAVEMEARFRKDLRLRHEPAQAVLHLRGFRRAELTINGKAIDLPAGGARRWKSVRAVTLAGSLYAGENRIVVTVANDRGPPALWMRLETPEQELVTDRSWEVRLAGAPWRPARLASDAVDVAALDPLAADVRPLRAAAAHWPWLAGVLLVCLGAVTGLELLARRFAGPGTAQRLVNVLVAGLLVLWIALVWNDSASLWIGDGFDAVGHLQYVQYILDHGALPRADEGWSMFQPPLYYAISAGVLKLAGLTTADPGAAPLLRLESLVYGLAQLLLLYGGLRLLFPSRPLLQSVGMVLAAFLPVQLTIYQFVANDALAATLGSAAILWALRLVRRESATGADYLILGVLLGAAMLAKFSMLIVVLVAAAVVAGDLHVRRGAAQALGSLGLVTFALFATCGWHFVRVAWRFGDPFVGNWDTGIVPGWWQDPGYLTLSFYTRLKDAIAAPLLSALNGFWPGIYSTLWGDGLIAGRTRLEVAPPWDYSLMAAGYVLALLPTVALVVGAGVATVRVVRRPRAAWVMAVGLAAATGFALLAWPLGHPIYSVIKASFATPAMLSLCAFGALGIEALARRGVGLRRVLLAALATWAVTAYATFWIPAGSVAAQARLGWLEASVPGQEARAETHLRHALQADPHRPLACMGQAKLLGRSGRTGQALEELRRMLDAHPRYVRGRLELAGLLERQGRFAEALEEYREVLRVAPGQPVAHLAVGQGLLAAGRVAEAIEEYRAALWSTPDSAEVHDALGVALMAAGREGDARYHFRMARRLEPRRGSGGGPGALR